MYYSQIAARLRGKLGDFSGVLAEGLPKVSRRFVAEMLYGLQASGSVVLAQIARTLEEGISVKKTEERLSRQIGRPGLRERLEANLLTLAARQLHADTLLIVDITDLSKPYAEKMEWLATVRDASAEGELTAGYWIVQVTGAELDTKRVIPLLQRLYSQNAPEFRSENTELIGVMDAVAKHIGKRGIWVMDRGGDRGVLLKKLLRTKKRFVVRLRGDRTLRVKGTEHAARTWAKRCPCPYRTTLIRKKGATEQPLELRLGYRTVQLPDREEPLSLLVAWGFGEEPLMLLTNLSLRRRCRVVDRVLRCYLRRWAIEETIRFVKQSYELEDVRLLRYRALQNLMPFVSGAAFFLCCVLGRRAKLQVMAGHVLVAAKRLFGIPDHQPYALADGLRSIFTRHPGRPKLPRWAQGQLQLFATLGP